MKNIIVCGKKRRNFILIRGLVFLFIICLFIFYLEIKRVCRDYSSIKKRRGKKRKKGNRLEHRGGRRRVVCYKAIAHLDKKKRKGEKCSFRSRYALTVITKLIRRKSQAGVIHFLSPSDKCDDKLETVLSERILVRFFFARLSQSLSFSLPAM